MILLGLVGMMDPPRVEAQGAVKTCKRVGIRSVMVTGDHQLPVTGLQYLFGPTSEVAPHRPGLGTGAHRHSAADSRHKADVWHHDPHTDGPDADQRHWYHGHGHHRGLQNAVAAILGACIERINALYLGSREYLQVLGIILISIAARFMPAGSS